MNGSARRRRRRMRPSPTSSPASARRACRSIVWSTEARKPACAPASARASRTGCACASARWAASSTASPSPRPRTRSARCLTGRAQIGALACARRRRDQRRRPPDARAAQSRPLAIVMSRLRRLIARSGLAARDASRPASPGPTSRRSCAPTASSSATSRRASTSRRSAAGSRRARPASSRRATDGSSSCSPAARCRRRGRAGAADRFRPRPPAPTCANGCSARKGRIGVLTEATVRVTRLPEREPFVGFFLPTGRAARRRCGNSRRRGSACRCRAWPTRPRPSRRLRLAGQRSRRRLARALPLSARLPATASACCSSASRGARRGRGDAARPRRAGASIARCRPDRCSARNGGRAASGRLSAQRAVVRRLRGRHDGDRVRLAARRGDGAGDRNRRPRRAGEARRDATPTRTCRMSMRRARASIRPSSTASDRTTKRASRAGASLKTAVGDAIVAEGGTITHQHGVGKDHRASSRPRRAMSASARCAR